jgi:hypothetical protein
LTRHSAAGLDALPVARLHPLAGTRHQPPGTWPGPAGYTEQAARLMNAAAEAAKETDDPNCCSWPRNKPPTCWRRQSGAPTGFAPMPRRSRRPPHTQTVYPDPNQDDATRAERNDPTDS